MGNFRNIELSKKATANIGALRPLAIFSPVYLLVILISLILVLGLILG
jgi:hypothetical protein